MAIFLLYLFYKSMLRCPPVKYNIPKVPLFYQSKVTIDKKVYDHYIAFNNKGQIIGNIVGKPETTGISDKVTFFPGFKKQKSYYINYLKSHKKGFGSKLLDFVQIISKKTGGEGKFHLIASDRYNAGKPPHIFYRKYGMESLDTFLMRDIDRHIKGEIGLMDIDTLDTPMYFIPEELKSKQAPKINILKNIINKVIRINA